MSCGSIEQEVPSHAAAISMQFGHDQHLLEPTASTCAHALRVLCTNKLIHSMLQLSQRACKQICWMTNKRSETRGNEWCNQDPLARKTHNLLFSNFPLYYLLYFYNKHNCFQTQLCPVSRTRSRPFLLALFLRILQCTSPPPSY